MHRSRRIVAAILIAAGLLCVSKHALAAVTQTSGVSSKGIALQGAYTGLADDPSAIYYNPAGMTQLDGTHVEIGGIFIFPQITYKDLAGNIHLSDKTARDSNIFVVSDYLGSVRVGFGAYTPFARDASFVSGPGGFTGRRAMVLRNDFTTAMAVELPWVENLSIGGGVTFSRGEMEGEATRAPPVGAHLEDADGWAMGGIFGVLYRPWDLLQLGLTYRTREVIDFSGIGSQSGTRDDFDLDWNFPSSISMGVAVFATDRATITANLDWVEWSRFHHLHRNFATLTDITDASELNNTWAPRVGIVYQATDHLGFRAGYAYEPTAGPSTNITPTAPDLEAHQFGLGMVLEFNDTMINVTYEHVAGVERSSGDNAALLTGSYDVESNSVSVSASRKF